MNSIKCKNCGLSNFASEVECRRCAKPFLNAVRQGHNSRQDKPPRRYSIVSLAIFAAVAFAAYYIYLGMQQSVAEVNANDAKRVASQPAQPPPANSRTESDRQRSAQVGNSLKDNPSFAAQKQHDEETRKIMQQASNSSQQ